MWKGEGEMWEGRVARLLGMFRGELGVDLLEVATRR